QRRVHAEPVGAGATMGEIGAEFAGEIVAGDDAHVDLVAEFAEDTRRPPADAISPGLVDAWAYPEILFDAASQLDQLLAFELERQVAGIGVLVGDLLDQGRIVPGLQVSADLAGTGAMQIADEFVCFGRAADGIIENKGRPHGISLEDPLRSV